MGQNDSTKLSYSETCKGQKLKTVTSTEKKYSSITPVIITVIIKEHHMKILSQNSIYFLRNPVSYSLKCPKIVKPLKT